MRHMDMTCTICLEDNMPPRALDGSGSDSECEPNVSDSNPSGMLACGHAFHSECIQKWLLNHDDCPTCKYVLRKPTVAEAGSRDTRDNAQPTDVPQGVRWGNQGFVTASTGLRHLDSGLHQLERSLVSLESEVRTMVQRMPNSVALPIPSGLHNTRVYSLNNRLDPGMQV